MYPKEIILDIEVVFRREEGETTRVKENRGSSNLSERVLVECRVNGPDPCGSEFHSCHR